MLFMFNTDIQPIKRGGLPKPSHRFRAKRERESVHKRANMLDLKKICAWAEVGCTQKEIAALLGIDQRWFAEQKQKSFEIEKALLTGYANLEYSLRSAQARLALSGHPGMLIWLGKQFLGQSDKQESKSETTVNVVLQNAMKEAREMTQQDREELLAIFERQRKPLLIDQAAPDAIQEAP